MASSDRMTDYKFQGRTGDSRRHDRAEEGVQLRKQKREEQLMKRRNVDVSAESEATQDMPTEDMMQYLESLRQQLALPDPEAVLAAAINVRAFLSRAHNPPIQAICDAGIVPHLVHLLHAHDRPDIQFEASWSITNIASGTTQQTQVVMDADAVPIFIQLISSSIVNLREQCVWALGNIAGDNPSARDFVLHHGVMQPLLKVLQREVEPALLQNASWTLSNLCRGKNPTPPRHLILPALHMLHRLLHNRNEEILIDACWALSYISEGSVERIQEVVDAGVCTRLVELLLHPRWSIVKPALRTLGNIVTGDDKQTQVAINAQILPNVRTLLSCQKDTIRREACWVLSNVLAGPALQIQAVLDANIIPHLIKLMSDGNFKTRKEACWAVSNATSGGSADQVRFLVQMGCIPPFCRILDAQDLRIVKVAMDGIQNILQVGHIPGGGNEFQQALEEAQGVEKLQFLVMHENAQISAQARHILDRHIHEHDDGPGMLTESEAGVASGSFGLSVAPQASRFNF